VVGAPPLFLHADEVIHSKIDTLQHRVLVHILEIHDFSPAESSDEDSPGSTSSNDSNGDGLPPRRSSPSSLRPWPRIYHLAGGTDAEELALPSFPRTHGATWAQSRRGTQSKVCPTSIVSGGSCMIQSNGGTPRPRRVDMMGALSSTHPQGPRLVANRTSTTDSLPGGPRTGCVPVAWTMTLSAIEWAGPDHHRPCASLSDPLLREFESHLRQALSPQPLPGWDSMEEEASCQPLWLPAS
jgi:hypothetical protein